jgi:hypothetical protein
MPRKAKAPDQLREDCLAVLADACVCVRGVLVR